ncbi:MAG: aspartate kinase [Cyanobacteria bacterium J06641_5]
MARIVQKYGGTSVGSTERIRAVAERLARTAAAGNQVVAVVSAMGKTTDRLVELAGEITANPCQREMDMLLSTGEQVSIALLSMALQEIGQPAISLTGAQVGIVTEAAHSRARILQISPDRIERHLQEGKVAVVAGFQGVSSHGELEITTLGRGGSDTSAVALAIALEANCCEIYTDVPGILTTDPRIVPEACLMAEITCDEMLELASLGATVLHPRAVELARNHGMPLAVRSSWSHEPGTRVLAPQSRGCSREALEFGHAVDAVEFDPLEARLALLHVPDAPGVAARIFGELSQAGIGVNIILQSLHAGNTNDIAFTVARTDLEAARTVTETIAADLQSQQPTELGEAIAVEVAPTTASVAIVGAGMIGRPGIAARMFAILAAAGINIRTIATSEVKVSCEIAPDCLETALQKLCAEFGLDAPRTATRPPASVNPPVRGVALDLDQARIALTNIPDRPGLAARIFGQLAECGISVDTILQSQRCHHHDGVVTRDIYFTVARNDVERARVPLAPLADEFSYAELLIDPDIAKVSIVGMGMNGAPAVATQFFAALAQQQINIRAITSAGLKISCIVSRDAGQKALQAVHTVFDLDRT